MALVTTLVGVTPEGTSRFLTNDLKITYSDYSWAPPNSKCSSAIHLLVKAFSWRAVSDSFEKFQSTASRKGLDSVLEQLHRL